MGPFQRELRKGFPWSDFTCEPGSRKTPWSLGMGKFPHPALPKDIGNEHVRIKDILYLKFMFYHIAIPSLHYIFWNAYEGYKTPRSKKLQRRRIYSS